MVSDGRLDASSKEHSQPSTSSQPSTESRHLLLSFSSQPPPSSKRIALFFHQCTGSEPHVEPRTSACHIISFSDLRSARKAMVHTSPSIDGVQGRLAYTALPDTERHANGTHPTTPHANRRTSTAVRDRGSLKETRLKRDDADEGKRLQGGSGTKEGGVRGLATTAEGLCGVWVMNLPNMSHSILKETLRENLQGAGRILTIQVEEKEEKRCALVLFSRLTQRTATFPVEHVVFESKGQSFPTQHCQVRAATCVQVLEAHNAYLEKNSALAAEVRHPAIPSTSTSSTPSSTLRHVNAFEPSACRTLYVGGLKKGTTVDALKREFDKFGHVVDVDIKNAESPAPFAFLQFAHIQSVVWAIHEKQKEDQQKGNPRGNKKFLPNFGRPTKTSRLWVGGVSGAEEETWLRKHVKGLGEGVELQYDTARHEGLVLAHSLDTAVAVYNSLSSHTMRGSDRSHVLAVDFCSDKMYTYFMERMNRHKEASELEKKLHQQLMATPPPSNSLARVNEGHGSLPSASPSVSVPPPPPSLSSPSSHKSSTTGSVSRRVEEGDGRAAAAPSSALPPLPPPPSYPKQPLSSRSSGEENQLSLQGESPSTSSSTQSPLPNGRGRRDEGTEKGDDAANPLRPDTIILKSRIGDFADRIDSFRTVSSPGEEKSATSSPLPADCGKKGNGRAVDDHFRRRIQHNRFTLKVDVDKDRIETAKTDEREVEVPSAVKGHESELQNGSKGDEGRERRTAVTPNRPHSLHGASSHRPSTLQITIPITNSTTVSTHSTHTSSVSAPNSASPSSRHAPPSTSTTVPPPPPRASVATTHPPPPLFPSSTATPLTPVSCRLLPATHPSDFSLPPPPFPLASVLSIPPPPPPAPLLPPTTPMTPISAVSTPNALRSPPLSTPFTANGWRSTPSTLSPSTASFNMASRLNRPLSVSSQQRPNLPKPQGRSFGVRNDSFSSAVGAVKGGAGAVARAPSTPTTLPARSASVSDKKAYRDSSQWFEKMLSQNDPKNTPKGVKKDEKRVEKEKKKERRENEGEKKEKQKREETKEERQKRKELKKKSKEKEREEMHRKDKNKQRKKEDRDDKKKSKKKRHHSSDESESASESDDYRSSLARQQSSIGGSDSDLGLPCSSMYDRVKGRRSSAAKKDDQESKKKEALELIREKQAKKQTKKRVHLSSSGSEDEQTHTQERMKRVKKEETSSEDETKVEGGERREKQRDEKEKKKRDKEIKKEEAESEEEESEREERKRRKKKRKRSVDTKELFGGEEEEDVKTAHSHNQKKSSQGEEYKGLPAKKWKKSEGGTLSETTSDESEEEEKSSKRSGTRLSESSATTHSEKDACALREDENDSEHMKDPPRLLTKAAMKVFTGVAERRKEPSPVIMRDDSSDSSDSSSDDEMVRAVEAAVMVDASAGYSEVPVVRDTVDSVREENTVEEKEERGQVKQEEEEAGRSTMEEEHVKKSVNTVVEEEGNKDTVAEDAEAESAARGLEGDLMETDTIESMFEDEDYPDPVYPPESFLDSIPDEEEREPLPSPSKMDLNRPADISPYLPPPHHTSMYAKAQQKQKEAAEAAAREQQQQLQHDRQGEGVTAAPLQSQPQNQNEEPSTSSSSSSTVEKEAAMCQSLQHSVPLVHGVEGIVSTGEMSRSSSTGSANSLRPYSLPSNAHPSNEAVAPTSVLQESFAANHPPVAASPAHSASGGGGNDAILKLKNIWEGRLTIKGAETNAQWNLIAGNAQLATSTFVHPPAAVTINQKMRLDNESIDNLQKKLMDAPHSYCALLVAPCGHGKEELLKNNEVMKKNFVQYLQKKSVAGISRIDTPHHTDGVYTVYTFPSCQFSDRFIENHSTHLFQTLRSRISSYLFVIILKEPNSK